MSLRQTLDLVRTVVDVVESRVESLAGPGDEQLLRESVLRFSREIAFAAAEVYAGAAEARGAWDARLEALVVDAVLRGEADDSMQSRAARSAGARSGTSPSSSAPLPLTDGGAAASVDDLRRAVRQHGRRGAGHRAAHPAHRDPRRHRGRPRPSSRPSPDCFGPGPDRRRPDRAPSLRRGPVGAGGAERTLRRRRLARRAADRGVARPCSRSARWPATGPRGASSSTGSTDPSPGRRSARCSPRPTAYLESGGSLEATARALFIHPNTVRYRLGRISDLTGYDLDAHRATPGRAASPWPSAGSRRRRRRAPPAPSVRARSTLVEGAVPCRRSPARPSRDIRRILQRIGRDFVTIGGRVLVGNAEGWNSC